MVFALTSACNCGSLAEADGWLESARRDGRDHFITGSAVTFAGARPGRRTGSVDCDIVPAVISARRAAG